MIIKIEIDCDSITQLFTHLAVIKKEIKAKAKASKISEDDEAGFPSKIEIEDHNCYGDHLVKIKN